MLKMLRGKNMIRICAWCGKTLGEKPPYSDKSKTHGACDSCTKRILKEEIRK